MNNISKVLATFAICAGIASAASIDAGRVEIGGSASIDAGLESNSFVSLWVSPFGMYYVSRGLAVGGSASFFTFISDYASNFNFGLGPRAAYYFDINSIMYPYVAGGLNYGYSSYDGHGSGDFSFPLGGGLRFFLNDFVTSDAGVNLSFGDYNQLSLSLGLSMFLK